MRSKKKQPAGEPEVSEFEAAKARWAEASARHAELAERVEAMRLARNQASAKTTPENIGTMPKHLIEKAKPYARLAHRRPARAADNLAVAEIELEEFLPALQEAKLEWAGAQRRETNRIAAGLQPRQRVAVKAIASALEALSQAIADEQEIHDELKSAAPLPTSPNLPDLGGEFADMCVSEWGSRAWKWAQRVRKLGII